MTRSTQNKATLVRRDVGNRLGTTIRVVSYAGKLWAVAGDFSDALGRSHKYAQSKITADPNVFVEYVQKVQVDENPAKMLILSEEECRRLIDGQAYGLDDPRIGDVLSWLDRGALKSEVNPEVFALREVEQPDQDDLFQEEPEVIGRILIDKHEQATTGKDTPEVRTLRLVSATPIKVPDAHHDKINAYCRDLLKVLLRYADVVEAEHLKSVIEDEVIGLISHRHCPGLNSARYELYRRYWLQGGEA